MSAGRAMVVAAGAGVAAYAIHRSAQPASAPKDLGYTSVDGENRAHKSAAVVERAARQALRMPCGARREPYADIPMDGRVGANFAAEWASEARSLAIRFGQLSWLNLSTGRPAITAECALDWIDVWLDAWWQARSAEPIRYGVGGGLDERLADARTVPSSGGGIAGSLLGERAITPLGRAWRALVEQRNAAQWLAGSRDPSATGKTYLHAASVCDSIKAFALALDAAAARELSGNAGQEALELAQGAARGVVGAATWVAEEVLGPLIGAAAAATVGAVLPYVAVGGALYFIARKQIA